MSDSSSNSMLSGLSAQFLKGRDRLEFDFRQKFQAGLMDYSVPLPTEVELSRRYGICRNTVRKVLQQLTDEGLLYKRHGSGTFAIAPEDRVPSSMVQLKILVILPSYEGEPRLLSSYDRLLLSGISDYAFQHSGRVFPRQAGEPCGRLYEQYRNLKFDGIIWERPTSDCHAIISELHQLHVPQVTISRQVPGVPSLYFDFHRGFEDVVRFFYSIGHRDFVFLDLDSSEKIFCRRRQAFQEEASRVLGRQDMAWVYTHDNVGDTDAILARIYADHPGLSALFFSSVLGCKVHSSLRKLGIRVPEDLTVLTLGDNPELLDDLMETSALREPRRELGWRAMELIHEQKRGGIYSDVPEFIRGELIIRQTCSSPHVSWKYES